MLIILKTLPIEFKQPDNNDIFDGMIFIGIPFAIILTISRIGFKNIQKDHIRSAITKTILIASGVFLLFVVYGFISFGANMCSWSMGETLFIHKAHYSSRIVKRYFGCGATDSSPATIGTFKTTDIPPFFIYVTKIDTTKIDSKVWERAKAE